jgi:hypothetical protein
VARRCFLCRIGGYRFSGPVSLRCLSVVFLTQKQRRAIGQHRLCLVVIISATPSIYGPVEGCMTCSPTSADHRPGPFMLRRAVAFLAPPSAPPAASTVIHDTGCWNAADATAQACLPSRSRCIVLCFAAVCWLQSAVFSSSTFNQHKITAHCQIFVVVCFCECCALLCGSFLFG